MKTWKLKVYGWGDPVLIDADNCEALEGRMIFWNNGSGRTSDTKVFIFYPDREHAVKVSVEKEDE